MLWAIGMLRICNFMTWWIKGYHYFYHGRRQAVEVEVDANGGTIPVPHVKAETTYSRYPFDFGKETPVTDWGRSVFIIVGG
jgi:hypothetical protein